MTFVYTYDTYRKIRKYRQMSLYARVMFLKKLHRSNINSHLKLYSLGDRELTTLYYKVNDYTSEQKTCRVYIYCTYSIQGVTGGTDQTSGECSLGQTIPIQPKTPISKVQWLQRYSPEKFETLTAITHLLITKYTLKLAGICGFCSVNICT